MKREIKFSLVFRDMWQSAGKYVPTVDQLTRVAPAIIEMGCFARVETNGGGFEQVNLLFGENPNKAVREWTKPFHAAGIQTHMLDRALNGLRMSPVPDDVRQLFYKVKKAQGTDIARTFCGLNDVRNIAPSIKYAKEAGMISQCSLCITHSPVHTVEYYTKMAFELIELGADEICIKDMAGIGRPYTLGRIVANIKEKYPEIPIQYHSHAGPGFNVASIMEVCNAGCDYIDVGMEPLSWGTGHADLLTVQAMLKDAGYKVPEINMEAYMKVRALVQEFMDDFLGLYISPKNRLMNSLLIGPGLPGGMMGSMMADLKGVHSGINLILKSKNQPELSIDDLLVMLFDEVEYVWPKLGYPPLVTPFSQYVKNVALMNVMQLVKGEERWTMIDNHTWDMILGKSGRLPGKLAPEIVELAKSKGYEFVDTDPQSNYPDALDEYRKEMDENGWEYGEDDEELFELAMHDRQYRDYKSGVAKKRFRDELERVKDASMAKSGYSEEEIKKLKRAKADPIIAPSKGQVLWEVSVEGPSSAPFIGRKYQHDEVFCYVSTPWGEYEKIMTGFTGRVVEVCAQQGANVNKGDVIAYIQRSDIFA